MAKISESTNPFITLAQQVCNGCDLVTTEENKLTTGEVVEAGKLTIEDFASCTIEGKEVGVVTFLEFPGKYYWGGQALSNMVSVFAERYDGMDNARAEYAAQKDKIVVTFDMTTTKNKQSFVRVTVQ